ncbi:MAG: hypothetical protein IJ087_18320 [Eggerthellaceae bacterium]|nr:hypothetical protein [Eggerthellaceae bacterium]
MSGPFDFLHIKSRTAGSSNELSFDVLDSHRRDLDEKRRANRARSPFLTGAPRPSQGSYTGVAGTSTLSAVPEVERRKRARRARAIRVRVLVVLLVVALVAAGAFFGFRLYQNRVDYVGRFSTLVEQLVDVDKSLVAVDRLMIDPLNTVERDKRDTALAGFPELESKLDALIAETRSLSREKMSPDDVTAIAKVEETSTARQDLLAVAADAFKLSEIANRQITEANTAWGMVLAGDAVAREATEIANSASTVEATQRARDKTVEAYDQMATARAQLLVIQQGIAGLDFSGEIGYIDKRLESLEAGIATSDALLAGDRATATASNDAYNTADRAAADLATRLPASITAQVKALYADEIARKKSLYDAGRAAAVAADATLRSLSEIH